GVRDRAMLETLYGGGLRVSELVGLNLDDIDFESDLVRVRGKGRRERLSPISPMAIRWIHHYLPIRQPTYPAAQFRHSPAGQGSRSPERSRIARTPQPYYHADLHPRHAGPLAAYISGGASSCSIRLFDFFYGRWRVIPPGF